MFNRYRKKASLKPIMTAFKYPRLRSAESIRLLLLRPSSSRDAPLECNMAGFALSALPRYETLSYTWEDQRPCRPIKCNDSELLTTPNVEAALRHLRRRVFSRHLWIDAICIDQSSLTERSHQVSLMDQIFQRATRVIVWLGVGDNTTARAIGMLKWVFPLYKLALHIPFLRYIALQTFRDIRVTFQDTLLHDTHSPALRNGGTWKSALQDSLEGLRRIVHHNWFRRIWTLQEISLARKAVVQCGDSKIQWTAFSNALTFENVFMKQSVPTPVLMEGGYCPSTPVFHVPFPARMQQIQSLQEWVRRSRQNKAWPTKYFPTQHQPPLRFIINLLLTGLNPDYRASDPKDRLLGLLGLLHVFETDLVVPDYRIPLSDILLEAFTAIASKQNSLEFLHFVTCDNSVSGLPSWIPGFSAIPWCPSPDNLGHSTDAHYGRRGSDFSIEGRKLHLSGVHVDSVDSSTEAISSKESHLQGCIKDYLGLQSSDFIAYIQTWIRFVGEAVTSWNLTQYDQTVLLFELLLHSQILPFYNNTCVLLPHSTVLSPQTRLLEHFQRWLLMVESQDSALIEGHDHVFDQAQHFISSEMININSEGGNSDDTVGYGRALLVIQRWVREYTVRKQLFTTTRGYVGTGWQGLRQGDQIVRVAGLTSPLLLRNVERVGSGQVYRLMGPCNVPALPGQEPWGGDSRDLRRFELV